MLYNFKFHTEYINLGTEEMPCWLYNCQKEEAQWLEKEDYESSILLFIERISACTNFLLKHSKEGN